MYIRSNLKELVDKRGWTIRECARQCDLQPETVRRMYNDSTMQYQRESLAKLCEGLEVGICDILKLEKDTAE